MITRREEDPQILRRHLDQGGGAWAGGGLTGFLRSWAAEARSTRSTDSQHAEKTTRFSLWLPIACVVGAAPPPKLRVSVILTRPSSADVINFWRCEDH